MKWIIIFIFSSNLALAQQSKTIHMLTPEVRGLLGTGGLQHAVLDKAKFLAAKGHQVKLIMPYFASLDKLKLKEVEIIEKEIAVVMNQGNSVFTTDIVEFPHPENPQIKIIGVKHKPGIGFANMFGNLTKDGTITYSLHPNQGEVFGYFNKAYTQWMDGLNFKQQPDVVILNDWHTGPASAYLKERKDKYHNQMVDKSSDVLQKKIPTVKGVIHNLRYQGIYDSNLFNFLNLDPKYFNAMDMHQNVNFLKTMLELSDYVEAVSLNYAKEITTARFGEGLDSITQRLAKEGRLSGLINGIDTDIWNPQTSGIEDPLFKDLSFSRDDPANKLEGKRRLLKKFFGVADDKTMLVALTARIDDQKGYNFLTGDQGALEKILQNSDQDIKFVIAGDPHGPRDQSPIVQSLEELQQKYPNKISVHKFSPQLERVFLYFSDIYLGASVFEPSGLAQMFAQSVGTVPLLTKVGGHVDSVEHLKTGLLFDLAYQGETLDRGKTIVNTVKAIEDTYHVFKDQKTFNEIKSNAMKLNNSWAQRIAYFDKFLDLVSINYFTEIKQKNISFDSPIDLTQEHQKLSSQGRFCFKQYLLKAQN